MTTLALFLLLFAVLVCCAVGVFDLLLQIKYELHSLNVRLETAPEEARKEDIPVDHLGEPGTVALQSESAESSASKS